MSEEKKEPQAVWFKNKNTGVKHEALENSEAYKHMQSNPLDYEVTEAPVVPEAPVEEPKKGKK